MDVSIYLKPSGRKYYISFSFAFVLLSAMLFFTAPLFPFNIYLVIFVLFVLDCIIIGSIFLYFQSRYIHIENDIITVKEGLIMSKIAVIPFNKVSEVTTQYTLMDKLLRVGTIMLDTAGTPKVEVSFSNIPCESITAFIGVFKRYKKIDKK